MHAIAAESISYLSPKMTTVSGLALFKIIEFSKEFKRVVASHTITFREQEIKNVKRAAKKVADSNADKATLGDLDALANLKEQMDSDN